MKRSLYLLGLLTVSVSAQTIQMKDGKTIVAKALRRQGDQIIATVDIPAAEVGQPAHSGDFGYAISQIAHLDFPEPPILRAMPDLIVQGKTAEGLAQLEPVVRYYENFRDAPGSWWVEAAMLKVQALASQGRDSEADPLARQILAAASEPETAHAAEVQLAGSQIRAGQYEKALAACDRALAESKRASTRALAFINRGQCLLAQKEWEAALLSFLEVPVFYPGERILLAPAQLGAGRAQAGMEDFPRAKATLQDVLKTYTAAAEAPLAKAELEKIARREKALAAAP